MSDEKPFGKLRLSVKGTNSGNGFDIFYDFGKSHNFVEFTSKNEFYFIQPWMQFPSKEYTDECMRVSIELVHRFNEFASMQDKNKWLEKENDRLNEMIVKLRDEVRDLKYPPTPTASVPDKEGCGR